MRSKSFSTQRSRPKVPTSPAVLQSGCFATILDHPPALKSWLDPVRLSRFPKSVHLCVRSPSVARCGAALKVNSRSCPSRKRNTV